MAHRRPAGRLVGSFAASLGNDNKLPLSLNKNHNKRLNNLERTDRLFVRSLYSFFRSFIPSFYPPWPKRRPLKHPRLWAEAARADVHHKMSSASLLFGLVRVTSVVQTAIFLAEESWTTFSEKYIPAAHTENRVVMASNFSDF